MRESRKSMRDFRSTEWEKRGFPIPHGGLSRHPSGRRSQTRWFLDRSRKSVRDFGSTAREKRRFPSPHGELNRHLSGRRSQARWVLGESRKSMWDFRSTEWEKRGFRLIGSRKGLAGPSLNATGKASFPRCSRTSDAGNGPWFGRRSQAR
jgi:hypothetical protein